MKQNWFGIFLFVALFVSCLDEEEIERDYPKVLTNSVTEISLSGATLSGTIETSALTKIFEYGFVWGQDENLLPENSFSLQFATPSTNTPSVKIKSSLVSQKIYYARFYIKTGNKTIYGNLVSFKSLGSEGPKITSLSPSSGVLGDTVIIRGRNFIDAADRNLVKFDIENVSILSVTDSTLKVIVPNNLSLEFEKIKVSVSIEGNVAYSPEPFTLLLSKIIPVITSTTPQSIKACDTVLVVGKNFKSGSDILKVLLQNNEEANLIKATDDSIMFSINLLPSDEFGFTIKSGRFDTSSEMDFTEQRPEFISISPLTHKPGAIMTLTVKNFPTCLPLIASAYGYEVDIISRTEDEVKIKLSDYCGYPGDINIVFGPSYYDNFLTTSAIPPQPLKIFSVEPNHGVLNQEVIIHGENFFAIEPYYTEFLNVTSYSETEIKGTVREIYYPGGSVDVVVKACDQLITLQDGFQYDPPEILDIDPKIITSPDQTITIVGKNFSPGMNTNVIYATNKPGANGDVYSSDINHITFSASTLIPNVLIETKFTSPITVRSVTGLDVTSSFDLTVNHAGPWKALPDFPGQSRNAGISFSIGGKGYVCMGTQDSNIFFDDLWEFDPATEAWTAKASFPGVHRYEVTGAAVAGNKAYLIAQGNQLWQYDQANNNWSRKADYPGAIAGDRVILSIDDKIYLGGGFMGGTSFEFWEYNPATDIWSRKADIPGYAYSYSIHFGFDGKGFVYGSLGDYQKYEFVYDPAINTWTNQQISNYQDLGSWKMLNFDNYVIVCGSHLYNQNNIMYKIIPGSNSWVSLPYAGPIRGSYVGFSIDEFGYIGLGSTGLSGTPLSKDIWRFDPEKF